MRLIKRIWSRIVLGAMSYNDPVCPVTDYKIKHFLDVAEKHNIPIKVEKAVGYKSIATIGMNTKITWWNSNFPYAYATNGKVELKVGGDFKFNNVRPHSDTILRLRKLEKSIC